jgi:hypothetical protein
VRPRDDDPFFECQTLREFGQARRDGIAGSDDHLACVRA